MNKEDLKSKIEQTKEKINKATILKNKYFDKISDENKKYAESHIGWIELRNLRLNYEDESAIDGYISKKKLIDELNSKLAKYQEALDKIELFQEEDKVKVIWDFLLNWKNDMYNYIKDNAELYFKLKKEYREALARYKKEHLEDFPENNWRVSWQSEKIFDEYYFSPILSLTKDLTSYGNLDEKRLNDILDKDIEAKYKNLQLKIKKICGNIIDASNLKIANNGMINGYIIGDLGKAIVETIVAGGYNQNVIVNTKHGQIAHYRVLVHPDNR